MITRVSRYLVIRKSKIQTRSLSISANAIKTPLYQLHEEHKGKLVEFAGYLLPEQYEKTGVLKVKTLIIKRNTWL